MNVGAGLLLLPALLLLGAGFVVPLAHLLTLSLQSPPVPWRRIAPC